MGKKTCTHKPHLRIRSGFGRLAGRKQDQRTQLVLRSPEAGYSGTPSSNNGCAHTSTSWSKRNVRVSTWQRFCTRHESSENLPFRNLFPVGKTNLERIGVREAIAAMVLRHSNKRVTRKHYIKPPSIEAVSAMQRLSEMLSTIKAPKLLPNCSPGAPKEVEVGGQFRSVQ